LMSKVSTGKTCAIIGLGLTILFMVIGVLVNLAQLANR
jgi:branched-subunit amino acid ABC-type transport system permease component